MRAPDILPQPYGYFRVTTHLPPSRPPRWVPLIAFLAVVFDASFHLAWSVLS